MVIGTDILLLNCYYLGMTVALMIRKILWLRIVLILAGCCLLSYGILSNNKTVIMWNLLFISINTFQVVRLLYEKKPIIFTAEMDFLYQKIFFEMRRKDFLFLWKKGNINETKDQLLCSKGTVPENLILIIKGKAEVKKDSQNIAILGRGDFIAEISFISGEETTADVYAKGVIKYIYWNHQTINKIKTDNNELINKLQIILSKDLAKKLSKK